jgi:hypothetical protein
LENDNLTKLYDEYIGIMNEKLKDHDPIALASILVTQGLTLYKTILTEDEFFRIVDKISESRHDVKSFGPDGKLQ